jgi:adenine-specific DNA-methyltransferase
METINDYMPLSNDWNDERLQTLKQLFPDWFTNEGSLNIDEVKKAVNSDSVNETERYEFRWFGKSQAKRNAFTPSNATLIYDEARSVNPTESENIIIEGENLEVLKLLSGSYREKIKFIYIDPPYNTGGDFVYSDNFSKDIKSYWEEEEITENGIKIDSNANTDGRYHSNWLNLMYSRLLIARQLLNEEGVIFISIDDNEIVSLRKLMDEIFGEENFIETIIWKNKYGAGAATRGFISVHEYILAYSKNPLKNIQGPLGEDEVKKHSRIDDKFNIRGPYRTQPLQTNSLGDRPNLVYPILWNGKKIMPNKQWVWSKERMESSILNNDVEISETKEGFSVMSKQYLKDINGQLRKGKPTSVLNGPFSQEGTKEIRELFDKEVFPFPKPSSLIKHLIGLTINEDSSNDFIILDFFGGSGSTGQAIMELNKEDGGNRKFILVQIPEATDEKSEAYKSGYKKISDITIERNKRVVNKNIKEKESQQPDLFAGDKKEEVSKGLGFKVYKLQKSNFPRVDFAPKPEFNETENLELLKKYIADKESQLVNAFNKEELLTEILLKNNFTLNYTTTPQEEFTKNEILFATDGEKETLICLDVSIAPETVSHFKAHTGTKFICLERALDTTIKYNLKHYLGDKFNAF